MPAPKIRNFRVTENSPLAEKCFLLKLEPADGEPMFTFKAGQWVMLYRTNPDGTPAGRAAFSIASAPSESASGFELAVKVYGNFTTALHDVQSGAILGVHGPFGIFTLKPELTHRMVIFAAGIGITPFRSMIREMIAQNDPREVLLIYTNRSRESKCFGKELRHLAAEHPKFRVVFVLTGKPSEDWDGEVGRIDQEKVDRLIPSVENTEFLTCGPNDFMDTVAQFLVSRGVDLKTRFRKERFD